MAKTRSVKSYVQFIHTPGGDDLAVLPRVEYDRLVAFAAEAQEDAAASRIVRYSARALKEGSEVVLPKAERPYRCWGYPVVPALYVILPAFILGNMFVHQQTEAAAASMNQASER